MNVKRPMNLDLTTMSFPVMAIVSILHRLTGVILFVLMPFVLYLFSLSVHSPSTFDAAQSMMHCVSAKVALWLFSSALAYHSLAGIRHLLSDLGLGEELKTARWTAYLLLVLVVLAIIILGILIW